MAPADGRDGSGFSGSRPVSAATWRADGLPAKPPSLAGILSGGLGGGGSDYGGTGCGSRSGSLCGAPPSSSTTTPDQQIHDSVRLVIPSGADRGAQLGPPCRRGGLMGFSRGVQGGPLPRGRGQGEEGTRGW